MTCQSGAGTVPRYGQKLNPGAGPQVPFLCSVFLVPEGLEKTGLMGFPACAQVSQKLQLNNSHCG